jgi:anaerobic selenocysteine-containing dehydrogenase
MAKIDRRDFVKMVGAGSVGAGAGFMLAETVKHPVEFLIPYPVPPEEFSAGIATWYNSVCSMCPAGCGITVRTREGRAKKIEGNVAHPVNQGRLCALGQAGLQVLYNPDRVTGPLLRSDDGDSLGFVQATWEEGIAVVAKRINELTAARQGNRVAFLSEGVRGHLAGLFELFMSQLGSDRLLHYDFAHPDTLYAANHRLFGEDTLPYYDLQNTRYLLSFGADYLNNWISPVHHSLGFGNSRQGRDDMRGKFVQIEPRMSVSGAAADEWIAARPGTEGVLALGLAHRIVAATTDAGDERRAWVKALAAYPTAQVAEQTGVPAATIERLADEFANTQPGLAIGGGAAANYGNGVDTLTAVNVLNYLVGNIGKEGGLVFNPSPSFGAISNARQASYRAMVALADDARAGKIDVLIVNNTNPVFSLPAAAGFADALAEIPLVVSLSSFIDDTTAKADVVLPSHTYLESWGDDIPEPGVGFPVAAISQPVVAPLYDTKATGDVVLALARQLGFDEALPWADMEDYLRQSWREIFARTGAADSSESFDTLWTDVLKAGVWGEKSRRDPAPLVIDPLTIDGIGVAPAKFAGSSDAFPFVLHPYLSTGLNDGRGANLPWMQELPDPMTSVVYGSWVEMNPKTAEDLGLKEGALVEVESPHGVVTAAVYLYPAIRPDVVAMPIGQGHDAFGRYASQRGVNPIKILAPEMEPGTGSLAWAATRVKLTATGRRAKFVKSGGESRQLGREIVQTTASGAHGSDSGADHSASLNSIPIKVVTS